MADVEVALMEFLDDLGHTVTSTPIDLEAKLPVLRIRRIGGGSDRDNDYPRVSVQAYAKPTASKPRAHFDLAELVDLKFLELAEYGPQKIGGICMEDPVKDSGPVELAYTNPSVRVTETIYRLTARR